MGALLLGLLMFAALTGPASAADDSDSMGDEQPAIALRLSPAVLEIPPTSGPSQHELRVDNLGSEPLTVETHLSDFTVTEDGTTQFLGPQEISATAWAKLDVATFEIAPGGRRDVTLTVQVPDDAEPGERYLSVIFAVPGDPDGDGNITITHRVAVKLYIAVPGQRTELLELGDLAGPRLIDTGPAPFELTVNNRGNVHRRFEEDTQLRATNGDNDFAFENFTVLGDSTRVVEAVWSDPPLLCWCTIEVEVDDGRGNLLTASTRVIAFPLRLSLALLALTLGLAILAFGRHRHRTARLDRQLHRQRDTNAPTPRSAPDMRPQHSPRPVRPSTQPERPTNPPPQPTPATPSAPLDPATTTTIETSPKAPPQAEPEQLNARLFTAHGTPDHERRRRPRR